MLGLILPAERYMVYQLERFEGGAPSFYCGARPLVEDFTCELTKILCGMNCNLWMMK